MADAKAGDWSRRRVVRGLAGTVAAFSLLASLLGGCGGGKSGSSDDNGVRQFPLSSLEQVPIVIGATTLQLWVMNTGDKRREGMMNLQDAEVGANEGMLFVYGSADYRYYYMKNTGIPLDIAYLGSDGTVVYISPLTPYSLEPVYSFAPAQYAIEVKQGTLARIGLSTGMKVSLPPVSAY